MLSLEYDMRRLRFLHVYADLFLLFVLLAVLRTVSLRLLSVEDVPTLEHANVASTVNVPARPTATDAATEVAKVTAPEVRTPVASSEPWMNHVSIFLPDPFSFRSLKFC